MRTPAFVLSALVALPLSLAAQTSPAQPQPGTVPVTSQTPATTNGPAPDAATGAPMTKSELKAQRKQQKNEEKSAKANAKAAKANEKSVKAQDKATNAAEKTQTPPQ